MRNGQVQGLKFGMRAGKFKVEFLSGKDIAQIERTQKNIPCLASRQQKIQ
jgi:hypothetical protein